ncbi:DNA polymerase epsilon subunit 4 isoform X2 [Hippopotamus amphibius kiboko]|uniref:DNA polymerase epsilon subunit 4 isoform X2 n=1 Tax=Hippopotamus amphibius kiboko TaxID=575201 RepID=UPI002591C23D|nr:DNA polymerase epsilon subunit 4 isoform X2 [Hippopotamus amphibius kiboko]
MAAVAPGNGAPREEEGAGGDAAAPQPQAPTSAPGARLSRLPLARVKALVKADPDVTLAGQEAIFILARAAVRRGHSEGRGTVCGNHCKRCLLLCSARKEENPSEERFG